MKILFALLISCVFLSGHMIAQEKVNPGQNEFSSFPVVFSKEKMQQDFQQFRTILEETHPALYDFTAKEVLDSLFDRNYARIDQGIHFREFLLLLTEVISQVGCGHSSMWIPGTYWKVAPEKLFPLKLIISEGQTYIKGSYFEEERIPPGSKLIGINHVPVESIISRLISLTSSDGFNPSYRSEKVAQNFSVKYAVAYGFPQEFIVEYVAPGKKKSQSVNLKTVSKQVIDLQKPNWKELSFNELEKGVGLLTINSFGYYGEVKMFHAFIDSVFNEIKMKGIDKLLLDLRHNSGGDPFCASYLWAYLQPESLPYFEDHYGKYDTLANPVPLPEQHYTGKLYTLIDGNTFSTTGHLLGLLKYHHVGDFIGQESGSTYTCTGNATYPGLDHTGIMVGTARVMRYTSAVKDMDPERGILPDHPVTISQEDIQEKRDPVLEKAIELSGL